MIREKDGTFGGWMGERGGGGVQWEAMTASVSWGEVRGYCGVKGRAGTHEAGVGSTKRN